MSARNVANGLGDEIWKVEFRDKGTDRQRNRERCSPRGSGKSLLRCAGVHQDSGRRFQKNRESSLHSPKASKRRESSRKSVVRRNSNTDGTGTMKSRTSSFRVGMLQTCKPCKPSEPAKSISFNLFTWSTGSCPETLKSTPHTADATTASIRKDCEP